MYYRILIASITLLLLSDYSFAEKPPIASKCVTEDPDGAFFRIHSAIDSMTTCIRATGESYNANDINSALTEDHDFLNKMKYFCLDYSKALQPPKKDSKHLIEIGDRVLSIRSFILKRDYERNSLDCDTSLPERTKKLFTDYFETVHVLGVSSSKLTEEQLKLLNEAIKSQVDGGLIWASANNYQEGEKVNEAETLRDEVLKIFKINTDNATHKMVKGPYDSSREEEWKTVDSVSANAVCYYPEPCAFYNLDTNATNAAIESIFVLFYSGDRTTSNYDKAYTANTPAEVKNDPTKLETEYDDFMGLVRIPLVELKVGKKFLYVQNMARSENPFDFAVLFEVADTAK
jgi:hypothetical protein